MMLQESCVAPCPTFLMMQLHPGVHHLHIPHCHHVACVLLSCTLLNRVL